MKGSYVISSAMSSPVSSLNKSLAPRKPPVKPRSPASTTPTPAKPNPASGQTPKPPQPRPRPIPGTQRPGKQPPGSATAGERPVIPPKPEAKAPVPPPRKASPGSVTAPGMLPMVSGTQTNRLDASALPALPARPARLENVLTVTGILANVATVAGVLYPIGSLFPDPDTVVLPDGVVIDKQAQAATHPGGAVQYADGTILHPEGVKQYPNGDIENPDGTWRKQDGPIFYPDANGQDRWLYPDGIVTDAEGNELGMIDPVQTAALFGAAV